MLQAMASDGFGGGPPTGGSGRGAHPLGDKGDDVTSTGVQLQWVVEVVRSMSLAVVCCGSLVGAGLHYGLIGASQVMSSSAEKEIGVIVVHDISCELSKGIKEAAETHGRESSRGFSQQHGC